MAQINERRVKPSEFVVAVNIVLDYIKCKVIKSAKRPDCNQQQNGDIESACLKNQGPCGNHSKQKKQYAFDDDQVGVLEV